ncbi:hypothetical protein F4806DRAFT_505481 [Annulohypoxylon nitens]|nr:hypothetical protein F4806DRAFT_505481 [Annulohypoxylon nitens]
MSHPIGGIRDRDFLNYSAHRRVNPVSVMALEDMTRGWKTGYNEYLHPITNSFVPCPVHMRLLGLDSNFMNRADVKIPSESRRLEIRKGERSPDKNPDEFGGLESNLDLSDGDLNQEDHPYHHALGRIANIAFGEFIAWKSCHRGSKGGRKVLGNIVGIHTSSKSRKRRKERDEEGDDESDEDQRPTSKGKKKFDKDENDTPRLSLACPYYKRDRVRHRSCLLKELTKISYIKQHLRRKHAQPLYCPSCGEIFRSQSDERAHIRDRACITRYFQAPEGLSHDQIQGLSDRVDKKLNLEQQWYSMWDDIFPGVRRPLSPYVQGPINEMLTNLREFLRDRGPTLIMENLHANEDIPYDTSHEERDLDAILRTIEYRLLTRFVNDFTETYASDTDSGRGESSSGSERVSAQANEFSSRRTTVELSQAELPGTSVNRAVAAPAMFSPITNMNEISQTGLDPYLGTTYGLPVSENDIMFNYLWNVGNSTSTDA